MTHLVSSRGQREGRTIKKRFVNCLWRVAMGVLPVAAVLCCVRAVAAPGAGDDLAARGKKDDVGSRPARLVSGDPAQSGAVVAGEPESTAVLAITPVPAKVGAYPPGTTIIGNELRAEVGGFRAFFDVQVSNWDPDFDGSPLLKVFQVKIDRSGFADSDAPGDQPDLDYALFACPGGDPTPCLLAFGEGWATCAKRGPPLNGHFCDPGYADGGGNRVDSWCAPSGGRCFVGTNDIGDHTPPWTRWVEVSNINAGRADHAFSCIRGPRIGQSCNINANCGVGGTCGVGTNPWPGPYYVGSLVLDVPTGARGKYTVGLSTFETFMEDGAADRIPLAAANGFIVNILLGQCCYGLGTPDEGCVDGVLRAECGDDEPGPFVFTPEDHCPPQGSDCSRHLGTCCETTSGECLDEVVEADCQVTHRVWTSETSCGEVPCVAETGACCNHDPFGPCTDGRTLAECSCDTCDWHKLQACAEIDCAPTSIPTISEWGLAILTLLLLTGAKILFARSHVARAY